MASQAQELSRKVKAFNDEMIAFVQSVPEASWRKQTESEKWPIGVVARHVGVGHYGILALAKMIIDGTPVPDFSSEQIAAMNKAHAEKHADCTKEEVLSILEAKGGKLVDFIAGLSDADLAATAVITDFGGKINVKQMIEGTLFHSGREHLESLRKTLNQA